MNSRLIKNIHAVVQYQLPAIVVQEHDHQMDEHYQTTEDNFEYIGQLHNR